MKDRVLAAYNELRLIVGYLGERSQFAWWITAFYEPASRLFLQPAFPKTSHMAQYHGVLAAARRVHDDHIGVGNVVHLFRLPEDIEQDLHRLMQNKPPNGETLLQSRAAALEALQRIAGQPGQVVEGPTAVGQQKDLLTNAAVRAIARAYLAAFQQGVKTYPYFVN